MVFITGLITLLTAIGIALNPALSINAASGALSLCAGVLVPSLFPFLVCSSLIIETGMAARLGKYLNPLLRPVFNVSGTGAVAVFLGLISGFPAGAKTVASLYAAGEINEWEAKRLLAFVNNPGPLFIIGTVGIGVFNSARAGYLLLLANTLAALTCGFLMRYYGPRRALDKPRAANGQKKAAGTLLGEAVYSSAVSTITLCGFVVFFSVFLALLERYNVLSLFTLFFEALGFGPYGSEALSKGLFEVTLGTGAAARAGLYAAALILGWGGGCVHLQTTAIIRPAGLSPKTHFLGKLITATLAPLYTRPLLIFIPMELEAVNTQKSLPLSYAMPEIMRKTLLIFTISLIIFAFFARGIKKRGRAKIKPI